MKQHDCYQLGQVIKTHGLKGEVSISLDVDFPEDYQHLESVFLEQQGKLVPFFIEHIQINGGKALIQFEEVETIEAASQLVGSALYLPLKNLPELEDGQYYFHDLVGCFVFEAGKNLGEVKEVVDLNGNELLTVISADQKEILIPIKDEILTRVDLKENRIEVTLPHGLLDIYNE